MYITKHSKKDMNERPHKHFRSFYSVETYSLFIEAILVRTILCETCEYQFSMYRSEMSVFQKPFGVEDSFFTKVQNRPKNIF